MPPTVHKTHDCGRNRIYQFRPLRDNTIHFRVKAAHDVNLCLTSSPCETPSSMFEIFLGGWGGHQSGIRRNKCQDVCRESTQGVLCPHEFKGFWIVAHKHAIKVGREGETKHFLCFKDPAMHFKPTHYGFCTAYGATGAWTFGDEDHCHGPPSFPGHRPPFPGHPPPRFPGHPPSYPGPPLPPPPPPPQGFFPPPHTGYPRPPNYPHY